MQKIAYFVVVSFLILAVIWLSWSCATYKGKIEGLKAKIEFLESEKNEKENLAKFYFNSFLFLQAILRQGYILQEDSDLHLRKGTMIIPPEVFEKMKEAKKGEAE